MPIREDYVAYQKSIAEELRSTKNRVRQLIGQEHWLTDGEHKESILRNALRSRLPETVRIGKGFVCFPNSAVGSRKSSGQIDILITSQHKPTLYKDGELVLVTADAVEAIVEVKTALSLSTRASFRHRSGLSYVLNQLADRAQFIRQNSSGKRCWVGLFVFEQEPIQDRLLLETLQQVTSGDKKRVINCIALGRNKFFHYWEHGKKQVASPVAGSVWHSYSMDGLAPAYFISNLAMYVSAETPESSEFPWFPIEGGKETVRCSYASLRGNQIGHF